jgi:hypothetical protein
MLFTGELRKQVLEMLAKQIATFNGQIYEKLPDKNKFVLLTLAQTLLATVERKYHNRDANTYKNGHEF